MLFRDREKMPRETLASLKDDELERLLQLVNRRRSDEMMRFSSSGENCELLQRAITELAKLRKRAKRGVILRKK